MIFFPITFFVHNQKSNGGGGGGGAWCERRWEPCPLHSYATGPYGSMVFLVILMSVATKRLFYFCTFIFLYVHT